MTNKNEVFLGKAGKIFGPYSAEEYEKMFASGELSKFTWIWDSKLLTWKTIDTPPPPLTISGSLDNKPTPSNDSIHWEMIQAICLDQFNLTSGKLEWITESGCVFVSDEIEETAKFPIHGKAELNLYEEAMKKLICVQVSVVDINLQKQRWTYRLRWKEAPKINSL